MTTGTTIFYDEDAEVAKRPILTSPYLLIFLSVSYVLFVKFFGPRFMAKREPFSLKYPMLIYNFIMVVFNASLVMRFINIYQPYGFLGLRYFWNYSCHPLERSTNPLVIPFINGMLDFYLSKIMDLTDTVFLVLRKKDSQLSYLHFFHHLTTMLGVWFFIFYVRDEFAAVMGVLNSFIHVIMYSYYFLAALGPSVKKYLWWKKYLTQLQIIQLFIGMAVLFWISINNCNVGKFKYLGWPLVVMNIVLFLNFYRKAYLEKKSK